jgi:hypothetical protein
MKPMNVKQTNTIILLTATLLSSCFSDTVKPDILLNYTPKITVNTDFDNIWVAGMPVSLEITTSEGSIDSTLPKLLKDATVEYVATDGSKGSLLYNPATEHYYTSQSFIPGTAVQLSIKHPSYPSVGTLVRFPETIEPAGTLSIAGGLDTSGNPADKLAISFADVGRVNNYYKINLYYFNNTISNWVPLAVPRSDPSLAGYNSIVQNDGGILFSDYLFNGKSKIITMNVPLGYVINNLGDKYKITLSSISEDLYLYYQSLQRAQDAKSINFQGGYNNAVVIHSNIDRGLGIIGTQSKEDVILK